jgi:hypothetical protein
MCLISVISYEVYDAHIGKVSYSKYPILFLLFKEYVLLANLK